LQAAHDAIFPTLWPNFGKSRWSMVRDRWDRDLYRALSSVRLVTLPGKGGPKGVREQKESEVTAAEQDRMKGQKWKRETESHKTESAANCGSCNILCVRFFFFAAGSLLCLFLLSFFFFVGLLGLAVGLLPFLLKALQQR